MSEDLHQRIRELEEECQKLRAENTQLRESQKPSPPIINQNKKANGIDAYLSPEDKIKLFRNLFRGREDVYPIRWQNHEGKSGYSPAFDRSKGFVAKEDRVFLPLSDQVIRDHLSGKIITGVYAIIPDDLCWFLAADFDKKTWKEDCRAFLTSCEALEIPAALECSRSGNGGHIWIFFQEPITANLARRLGAVLLTHTMQSFCRREKLALVPIPRRQTRRFFKRKTQPKMGRALIITAPNRTLTAPEPYQGKN